MTISLAPNTATGSEELLASCSQRLGVTARSIQPLNGGRNNRACRVLCANGHQYVLKHYFVDPVDGRSRLEVEFGGLTFLWQHGIRCIPQPLLAARAEGWALYEHVAGDAIAPVASTDGDLDQVMAFIAQLKALRASEGSAELPLASEACLSAHAIVEAVETRLRRLQAVRPDTAVAHELHDFLGRVFMPVKQQLVGEQQHECARLGWSWANNISEERRILSPSDFGFHNALRRPDGRVIFVDFEYFGWDNPAKMIADFILHPAMTLRQAFRDRMRQEAVALFDDQPDLPDRVRMVWPLCGLNWCLILLNEFVPEHQRRRDFAYASPSAKPGRLRAQLDQAQQLLQRVVRRDA